MSRIIYDWNGSTGHGRYISKKKTYRKDFWQPFKVFNKQTEPKTQIQCTSGEFGFSGSFPFKRPFLVFRSCQRFSFQTCTVRERSSGSHRRVSDVFTQIRYKKVVLRRFHTGRGIHTSEGRDWELRQLVGQNLCWRYRMYMVTVTRTSLNKYPGRKGDKDTTKFRSSSCIGETRELLVESLTESIEDSS